MTWSPQTIVVVFPVPAPALTIRCGELSVPRVLGKANRFEAITGLVRAGATVRTGMTFFGVVGDTGDELVGAAGVGPDDEAGTGESVIPESAEPALEAERAAVLVLPEPLFGPLVPGDAVVTPTAGWVVPVGSGPFSPSTFGLPNSGDSGCFNLDLAGPFRFRGAAGLALGAAFLVGFAGFLSFAMIVLRS